MNRRNLLRYGTAAVGTAMTENASYLFGPPSGRKQRVQVSVNEDKVLGTIPNDFVGLGYEISSVARPGLLSAGNSAYVQMLKTLGSAGVIRIGGNTADYASYSADGPAVSTPKGSIVTKESLQQLGTFLNATGWKLIWSVNLGEQKEAEAVDEAQAVSEIAKEKLLALEIGNEVDLFAHEGHRHSGYDFDTYLGEYRRYKAAIRAKLPNAPFAGPDVAGQTSWVSQFAQAEGSDLKLLTAHYYRGGQSPASSLEMLFNPDPKLARMLESLKRVSTGAEIPYRICETNSFSGGGKPGVSGTFGAALWVLEYLFILASYNAAGVNIETGVNQLGFVSHYSPIGDDEHGTYTAHPEYYGMLAFTQASQGRRVALDSQTGDLNFASLAVSRNRRVIVTLINKDRIREALVGIRCKKRIAQATAIRLVAPSLESKSRVTLGQAAVTPDGRWEPLEPELLRVNSRGASIMVPPGSAALVTLTL